MRVGGQLAVVMLLVCAAPGAGAQLPNEIPVAYEEAELATVVSELGRALGLVIVYEPSVPSGRVTIAAENTVPPEQALEMLRAALLASGYALLPATPGVHKILPIEGARSAAPWILTDEVGRGERLITAAIQLDHADPAELLRQLSPLIDQRGLAIPYPATRSLILATTEARFQRLLRIARALDRAEWTRIKVMPLRYAGVQDTARQLQEAFPPEQHSRYTSVLDESTSSLILEAPAPLLERLERFVHMLDIPQRRSGTLQVVRIRNADAEPLAERLRALASETGDGLGGQDYDVVADVPTNSLVIRASPATFRALADLIAELDRLPRQVELDLLVLDVGTTDELALAFDALLPLVDIRNADTIGFFTTGTLAGLAQPVETIPGFVTRVTRDPLLVPFTGPAGPTTIIIPEGGISLTANQADVSFRTLMQPRLLAASGEEHRLFSGETVPIPVSSAPSDPTSPLEIFATRTDIERRDVGLELVLRPRALSGELVELEIVARLEAVLPSRLELEGVDLAALGLDPDLIAALLERTGPPLRRVELESRIRLSEGVVALVASSPQPDITTVRFRVPFLGRIPILGWFFRSERQVVSARRFLLAVQADVIESPSELRAYALERERALRRESERTKALEPASGTAYALRVETFSLGDRAEALAHELLDLSPRVTAWGENVQRRYDVYIELESLDRLPALLRTLRERGRRGRLVAIPASESGA